MVWQLHRSFGAGEISPAMYGLVEDPQLMTGCKELTNAVLSRYGGARKRPGSRYIANVIGNYKCRIFSFRPSTGGDYVVMVTSADASPHRHVTLWDTNGQVDNWADGQPKSPFPDPASAPVAAPGATPPTFVSASNSYLHFWTQADLDELEAFQYEDRLYLLCANKPPCLLITNPTGTWSWGVADIFGGAPGVRSSTLPSITVTSDGTTITATSSVPLFTSADEGRFFRLGQERVDPNNAPVQAEQDRHGNWFEVLTVKGPTKATIRSRMSFSLQEFLDFTEVWDDWAGPFEATASTDTWTFVSGPGGTTLDSNISSYTRVSSAGANFKPSDVGMPFYVSGGTPLQTGIIIRYVSASQADVYRIGDNIGLPNANIQMTQLVDPWNGLERSMVAFQGAEPSPVDDGKFKSSGTTVLIPSGHATAQDYFKGTSVGGTVEVGGGVVSVYSETDSGSNTTTWEYKLRSTPKHLGPYHKYGVGWSSTVGFPTVGTSHQDRVWLSGFSGEGNLILASGTGAPQDFTVGANASDPLRLSVSDADGGVVRWMSSFQDLLFGTDQHEYRLQGSPVSALSLGVDRQTAYGGSLVPAVQAGSVVVFVGRGGRNIRQASFEFQRQRYLAPDLTDSADHLWDLGYETKRLAYSAHPDQILAALVNNGTRNEIMALSLRPETGVQGWSPWDFDTSDDIEDIVATGDESFAVVAKRTINSGGTVVRHLEFIEPGNVCDAQVTKTTGFTATQITGLSYLRGETVQVVGDGVYVGSFAVDGSGNLDLTGTYVTAPTTIIVGLPITFTLTPVTLDLRTRDFSSTMGWLRNVRRAHVLLRNSRGLTTEGFSYQTIPASTPTTAIAALNGWIDLPVIGEHGRDPDVTLTQNVPYDFEVASMNMKVEVE